MTRREALAAIYQQLAGEPAVVVTPHHAGRSVSPDLCRDMVTYLDGVFYAYPLETTQPMRMVQHWDIDGDPLGKPRLEAAPRQDVFRHRDPATLCEMLRAAGYPRPARRGFKRGMVEAQQ